MFKKFFAFLLVFVMLLSSTLVYAGGVEADLNTDMFLLETEPICPDELLAQLSAVGRSIISSESDELIQLLVEAQLRGYTVRMATFHFTEEGFFTEEEFASIYARSWPFMHLRGTVTHTPSRVVWELRNVDEPRVTTWLDGAVAELYAFGDGRLLDRSSIGGRWIPTQTSVNLTVTGSPWLQSFLNATENSRHFWASVMNWN